jgi:hypothetical protein
MYNLGKTANIKAQQRKQMYKASKRRITKQSKPNIKTSTPNEESATAEAAPVADIATALISCPLQR